MPISTRASQFAAQINRFLAMEPEKFMGKAPVYSDFDGANATEVVGQLTSLRTTYEPLLSSGQHNQLSFNVINQLQAILSNVLNSYEQLVRSPDQGSFQNFAQQLDSFMHHTAMYGVPFAAAGGAQLEATRAALQQELDRARHSNGELENLKIAVRNLITPAVAGSLSQSFTARRNVLMWGRLLWLTATVALGITASLATYALVEHITTGLDALAKQTDSQSSAGVWAAILLRTIVLLPVFAAFGFAFSQYRKEREYEEEYAHKAAVASSLPNYSDLAREDRVRDQIVTAATDVVFVSPGEQARRAEKSGAMLGELKEVIDVLAKAAGRK